MKIRIGLPLANNCEIKRETEQSLLNLNNCTRGYEYELFVTRGSNISTNRNQCITNSQLMYQDNFDFDYYLSLDGDIEFTLENVYQLIDADKDIIAGIYQYKTDEKLAVGGNYDFGKVTDKIQWESKGIHKVDWIGAGFILIKSEVFETLEFPYFRGELIIYKKGKDTYQDISSDDIGFCLNAERCDIPIYVNCDCKVKHII